MAKRKVGRPKKKGKGKRTGKTKATKIKALKRKIATIKKKITKVKHGKGTKTRKQNGRGFGDWIKKAMDRAKGFIAPINDVLKKTKLISTVGSMMGPTGQAVAGVADSLGYGKLLKKYLKKKK